MAEVTATVAPTVEYNVYCNGMPKATNSDLQTAQMLAQHYFSEVVRAGDAVPTIKVTKRTIQGDKVTEEPV